MRKSVCMIILVVILLATMCTAFAKTSSIDVTYDEVSPECMVGEGMGNGCYVNLPQNHADMDIQLCSSDGDLHVVFLGYDDEVLWDSAHAGPLGTGVIAVQSGEMADFYCGSDVKRILVYHLRRYVNQTPVKTATFWVQGVSEHRGGSGAFGGGGSTYGGR